MIKIKTFETIKTFPISIHILVIGEGISALAMGIFNFLQILYYNFIGLSPEAIGIIFSIGSLFSLIGFFIGPFIKIFGRKNLLCIGVIILSLGIGINVLFTNFIIILLGQIIISIGTSLIQVTELQLLYSYTDESKECCAYSYKYSIALITSALGILIGGNMNKIPYLENRGYRFLFLGSSIVLFVTSIARYFFLPKDAIEENQTKNPQKILYLSLQSIKSDIKIRRFAVLLFCATLGFAGVGPYNNLILKIAFGLENDVISYFSFFLTIFSMIGVVLMPTIIEKVGVEMFNICLFAITIGSCVLLTLINESRFFIGILVIRCIFAFLIACSLESLMMSNIDLEHRDVFASVKMLVSGIAVGLGNFFGGFILNHFGYKGNYLYGAVVLTVAILIFYTKVRHYLVNKTVSKDCR